MKNNEYNKVKVTNENNKNIPEFVTGPKSEIASYSETVKPYKDELNSRHTTNDKVEENVLNKDKKTSAFNRKDYKKIQHGPTHLASTAGHTVIAATTVSVSVVAVVAIGTTFINEYNEENDPIIYLESDVTTDSLTFRFAVSKALIHYGDIGGQDGQAISNENYNLKAAIYNETYRQDEMIGELSDYEVDPDNFIEGWMGFYELTPNTSYTLCIYLEHIKFNPEAQSEEVLGVNNLSYRTFSTKPIPSNLISFTNISPSGSGVSFEFKVAPETVGAIRGESQVDANALALYAEINGVDYFDSLFITDIYVDRESNDLFCSGAFNNLSPNTSYNLKICQSRETEYALLGMEEFTTLEATSGFNGINIPEEVSFYEHKFAVTLDYFDSSDNPTYSDFNLVLQDSSYNSLQSFTLEATTDEQILEISKSDNATSDTQIYDYNFDAVSYYSLSVYNNEIGSYQSLIGDEPITFVDTDYSGFNSIQTPYAIQFDSTTGTSTNAIMPVKLDFVDTAHNYEDGFILNLTTPRASFTANLSRTTDWQYANINENGIDVYLNSDFTVSITSPSTGEILLPEQTEQIVEASENNIYDIKFTDLLNNSLEFSDTNLRFSYTVIYLFPNSNADMKLVFIDKSTSDEFVFNMSLNSLPTSNAIYSSLSAPDSYPSGCSFDTYANVVSAYNNRTFDVYARYQTQPGALEQDSLICEGITFNFA